jgi:hypothetical protein
VLVVETEETDLLFPDMGVGVDHDFFSDTGQRDQAAGGHIDLIADPADLDTDPSFEGGDENPPQPADHRRASRSGAARR